MKNKLFLISLLALFSGLLLLGIRTGSSEIGNNIILQAFQDYDPENSLHYIIVNIRLPRILLAFVVGGSLAFCGYLMQAMVNNPLADPYILGTASGASLGASIVYLVLPVTVVPLFLPSLAAFGGATVVTLAAVSIAYHKGQLSPVRLLLAGMALSSLTVAMISFLIFFSGDESKLRNIIFWSMGSFDGARWSLLPLPAIVLALFVFLFTFLNKQINILLLGESRAYHLGVNVYKLRWYILASTALLTGFAVATSGPIGFVGLIVPHVIRGIFGVSGKYNLPFTALLGGVFMLSCDILSRLLYPPAGIPIGIITSFLGIPFFVYLLSRNSFRFG